MRGGLISEIIQHQMKSRWFWRDYLRKRGLMEKPIRYNPAMQRKDDRIRMSTGNRFGEILTRNGNLIKAGLTITHPTGARAARYKLASGGYTSNYDDPAFDVS